MFLSISLSLSVDPRAFRGSPVVCHLVEPLFQTEFQDGKMRIVVDCYGPDQHLCALEKKDGWHWRVHRIIRVTGHATVPTHEINARLCLTARVRARRLNAVSRLRLSMDKSLRRSLRQARNEANVELTACQPTWALRLLADFCMRYYATYA